MKENIPYINFQNYILRSSIFSIDFYKSLTSGKKISDEDFKTHFENPIIQESIYLASPSLFKKAKKWYNGKIKAKKEEDKIKLSMLKYFSRMSSRATPFGLFAGSTVGKFSNRTSIKLKDIYEYKRHTRLDMSFLVTLSQELQKTEIIKKQIRFFPNTSIYRIGDQLRYVEYKYINNMRSHQIVSVDNSRYLAKILKRAQKGILVSSIIHILVEEGFSADESNNFIEELISSQILISELEPSVSGPEFVYQIYSVLEKLEGVDKILKILKDAETRIKEIDKNIGNSVKAYNEIVDILKELEIEFDPKYIFQTDLEISCKNNTLDRGLLDDISKGLALLNKLSFSTHSANLDKFKTAFYERFGGREIPLSKALDIDTGIRYNQNHGSDGINPLVDDLYFSKLMIDDSYDIKWNSIFTFFQKKILDSYKTNDYKIVLDDLELTDYQVNWMNLPDTFSCITEIIVEDGKEKIIFSGGIGSSAANLLGRFCHGDKNIYLYTKSIVEIEKQINKDKILAEIIHLPESRTGNILLRPSLREYEIPYLAKSFKNKENQLSLDDLMISIKNGSYLLLRSRKHNKEVIPRLTNAHNYSFNSLPLYNFLCDLQFQDLRTNIGFNITPFYKDFEFIPRIEYHNLILQVATWNIKRRSLKSIESCMNDIEFEKAVKLFKQKLNLPQYVKLIEGDNELLINFNNLTSVRMLLTIVRKKTNFTLSEFLFYKDGIVKNRSNNYINQIIISFYNRKKLEEK